MKSIVKQLSISICPLVALSACAGGGDLDELPPVGEAPATQAAGNAPVYGTAISDTPVLIGEPYEINGVTYTPADTGRYDEVGLASYYGNELGGRATANGEIFNPSGISAAHRTLPLPSYVEVTSLVSGRTILVRINDRGPFSGDRIIDLSVGAARQLGILDQGTAPVRVRRVDPIEADKARLRAGQSAQERLPVSPQLLTALRGQFERGGGVIPDATPPEGAMAGGGVNTVPVPAPNSQPNSPNSGGAGVTWQPGEQTIATPVPTAPPTNTNAATGQYVVQLGAFSSASNAQRMATRAQSLGNIQIVQAGNIRRVRLGPFATEAEANAAMRRARSAGFSGARVLRNR